jgi:hypothetical protein
LDGVRAADIKLLPQDTPAVAGTPTQTSGWGLTETHGFTSVALLKADVPIYDYDQCKALYLDALLPNDICAGTVEVDACAGDTAVAPSSTTAPWSASQTGATTAATAVTLADTSTPPSTPTGSCKTLALD